MPVIYNSHRVPVSIHTGLDPNLTMLPIFQLTPKFHHRVWGGQQLLVNPADPVGEAWLVHDDNLVQGGPLQGQTLAQVTSQYSVALFGPSSERFGARFPLLIKILDCADWLSVQVHPNDAQAVAMAGPGMFGKTEAWHVLAAKPRALLISGVKPGTTHQTLAAAIQNGTVLDVVEQHEVVTGNTVYMPAGTIHALGPGLLIYEVQQSSDITYRVWDWNRPASARRALHIAESLVVSNPELTGTILSLGELDGAGRVLTNPFFLFDVLRVGGSFGQIITGDTALSECHCLTVTSGNAAVAAAGVSVSLKRFDSVVVPASIGKYVIHADINAVIMRSIPSPG